MVMNVPKWLGKYLDAEGCRQIENAVRSAERRTHCEIVPMIVRGSAIANFAKPTIACILLLILFVFDAPQHVLGILPNLDHGGSLAIVLAVCATSTELLSRSAVIHRFLAGHIGAEHAALRAELEFYRAGLQQTANSVGILIFVSIREKRASILADQGIAKVLPPETWDQAIKMLLDAISQRSMSKGFIEAIGYCENLLAGPFPAKLDEINELSDHLIIKE
jgi:putative membrane protein